MNLYLNNECQILHEKWTGQIKTKLVRKEIKIIMNENVYVNVFCVIGIIAFVIIILWIGYNFYPIIKRNIFGTQNRLHENRDVEDYERNPNRDETSTEEWNDTRIIYRKNPSVNRCSDTGLFLNHIVLGTRYMTC